VAPRAAKNPFARRSGGIKTRCEHALGPHRPATPPLSHRRDREANSNKQGDLHQGDRNGRTHAGIEISLSPRGKQGKELETQRKKEAKTEKGKKHDRQGREKTGKYDVPSRTWRHKNATGEHKDRTAQEEEEKKASSRGTESHTLG